MSEISRRLAGAAAFAAYDFHIARKGGELRKNFYLGKFRQKPCRGSRTRG